MTGEKGQIVTNATRSDGACPSGHAVWVNSERGLTSRSDVAILAVRRSGVVVELAVEILVELT